MRGQVFLPLPAPWAAQSWVDHFLGFVDEESWLAHLCAPLLCRWLCPTPSPCASREIANPRPRATRTAGGMLWLYGA